MAAAKKDSTINYVHQTAILCETIKKEQNNQKLYTNYSINPFKKNLTCHLEGKEQVFSDWIVPPDIEETKFGTSDQEASPSAVFTLTGKPNSTHDSADGEEDDDFLQVIKRANQTPVEKFDFPQTEAQEIGWSTKPLAAFTGMALRTLVMRNYGGKSSIDHQREDPRLHHPKKHSEITIFMDAYWRQKEQSENLN